jgi:UMP-CMP kinase
LTQFENPHLVLFFACPRDLARQRVVTRLEGREGDNEATFRRRFAEFIELNPPILDYYGPQSMKQQLIEVGLGIQDTSV